MDKQKNNHPAPELIVEKWFNTASDLTLESMRGRPILIHAFQMLCPGCVAHAIPQAQKVQSIFEKTDLAVIGLHCVFEHHSAMTPVALEAFLHEYRISFPVAVDTPSKRGDIPETMAAYEMRGTPTMLLINRSGELVANLFGQVEDLALGSMIQSLLDDKGSLTDQDNSESPAEEEGRCNEEGCQLT